MQKNELETARYLECGGERIYSVRYGCEAPIAQVLLCGPFAPDRLYSLAAWAKWARFLTKSGLAAARFDYRGTGESTGRFSEIDFGTWLRDIEAMSDLVVAESGGLPLVLHGLGLGALLAQKAFSAGRGDGLLMWSPPAQALDILNQGLMMRLSTDMLLLRQTQRKSAKDYVQEMKSGETVQIDGYAWSGALWSSGEQFSLDRAFAVPGEGEDENGRPWRHVMLNDRLSPLVKSQSTLRAMNPRAAVVPAAPLNRDFSDFFGPQALWIRDIAQGREKAGRHA